MDIAKNKDNIKVYIDKDYNKDTTTGNIQILDTDQLAASEYEITTGEDQLSFTIQIKTIKDYTPGAHIVVRYQGSLNNSAVIAPGVNTNEVKLEYSNNPNDGGEGDTGTTEIDKVGVFTYELDINKFSKSTNELIEGAKFKVWNAETGGKFAAFKKVENTYKFMGWFKDGDPIDSEYTTELTSEDGKYQVQGLDSGTYYLEETAAPDGYAKLTNRVELELKVNYTKTGDDVSDKTNFHVQDWDGTQDVNKGPFKTLVTITEDGKDNASLNKTTGSMDVYNGRESSLPETGGMGTTMLYTVGALLAGGAAVFYVVNRRTKNEE